MGAHYICVGRRTFRVLAILSFGMALVLLLMSSNGGKREMQTIEENYLGTRMIMVTSRRPSTKQTHSADSATTTAKTVAHNRKITTRRRKAVKKAVKPPNLDGWTADDKGVLVHKGISPNTHNFKYVIEEKSLCADFDVDRQKLLIMVESSAADYNYRRTIRITWGLKFLQKALNYRVVYLLGKSEHAIVEDSVYKESKVHGDVVQQDFREDWRNLTKKTVMGLRWTTEHCPRADYVMKTDQDIVVHVPNLLKDIKKHEKDGHLLLCHINRNLKILRSRDVGEGMAKYHVGLEIPGKYFPSCCGGLGYVMSRSVVRTLYKTAIKTTELFIEDAFITGICREKAGIKLTSSPNIRVRPNVIANQGVCAFKDGRITSSELNTNEIKILWEGMNTKGFFCLQPIDNPVVQQFI